MTDIYENDATYLPILADAMKSVVAEMIEMGEADPTIEGSDDTIQFVRAHWPSIVTEEIQEGPTGHLWLAVVEATDTDTLAALALVLKETA